MEYSGEVQWSTRHWSNVEYTGVQMGTVESVEYSRISGVQWSTVEYRGVQWSTVESVECSGVQ